MLHPRGAALGARDAGRPGRIEAPARRGRGRRPRHRGHRHGRGRLARHRQEPRRHDALGCRIRGHQPRHGHHPGAVRRRRRGARGDDRRHERPAHDHDPAHEGDHRRPRRRRAQGQGQGHDRRRPRHPGLRRRDRRRRLRRQRRRRRRPCQVPGEVMPEASAPGRLAPRVSMLTDDAFVYVHGQTLELLATVGVRFASARARALLREAGARVDDDSMVVRIPAELVERAVASAPHDVLLAARDGEHDALLDRSRTFVGHDGMGAMTMDHRTGERRPSTDQDLYEACVVADALDELGFCWYVATPNDAVPAVQSLQGIVTMLRGSGKHAQGDLSDPLLVPYALEAAAAASPGGVWDPARPVFSIVYCPVSPLQHDPEALDAAMLLAEHGVPIVVYSLALAGATAPITLAGTIVQTNAEILSGLVALQLAAPGSPFVYVGNSSILDMKTSTYGACGPEALLFNLALTEMGHRYGFPVLSGGLSSDAKELCMQSGYEGGTMALLSTLAHADLFVGVGMLDSAQFLYLPKMVLDAEVVAQCAHVARGVQLDDESVMLEVSARIGPGGHFLGARETRSFLRRGEHYQLKVFQRGSYEAWRAQPVPEAERATAVVDDILATHRPPALPVGAEERMAAAVAAAAEGRG
ncbi:MAG: trimethylamine methyltransferase family protein [Thermoleophilia bacterium]|nr:trimethylamine methyltransferase family protein [Thermoleophilia bacterium]